MTEWLRDEEVLSVVDELRSLGVQKYISLPQIVVVGDQSSGKSSLLEYISRVPFPKGAGMCTTFATQLIMGRDPKDIDNEGATDDHEDRENDDGFRAEVMLHPDVPGIRYEPVKRREDVAKVITSIQNQFKERHDGQQRVITDQILTIELYHKSYPRLTLVDLPGFVHVGFPGQAKTVVKDIEELADGYIKDKRSIVLAVVPAVSDMATNIVLKKTKEHDPDGKRTMCIFTKLDRVEHAHAEGIEEVDKLVRFETHVENERRLLNSDPWNEIDEDDKGIETLIAKLTKLLRSHVRDELPAVRSELLQKLELAKAQLLKLGTSLENDDLEKKTFIKMKAITDVTRKLIEVGDGRGLYTDEGLRPALVKLGKALQRALLTKTLDFSKNLKDKDILAVIAASRGRDLDGFVPAQALSNIVRSCVRDWAAPTENYLTNVFQALRKVLKAILSEADAALVPHIWSTGEAFLKDLEKKARTEADEFLHDEIYFPYTFDSKYLESLQQERLTALTAPISGTQGTSVDKVNRTVDIEKLLPNELQIAFRSYIVIAITRFVDTISIHVIERFVFRHGKDWLQDALLKIDLTKVKEDERVAKNRKKLGKEVETLERAISKVESL
ncbi:hypothetical protein HDU96_006390 [Phlyctochytrium bullatum]|nr:hypothetical protein HDU96_006390 [Phlyctochytrium bullatum]